MRKIIKAATLTLALAIPVWAGNIGQPIAPPPDGRQAPVSTVSGDMGCPIAGSEIAMTLLKTLLVLF